FAAWIVDLTLRVRLCIPHAEREVYYGAGSRRPAEVGGMATADVCVIYNPAAGRGLMARRLEGLKRALAGRAEFRPTQVPGHADELAAEAARAGFPLVGAAGGDGTIHEVANGL